MIACCNEGNCQLRKVYKATETLQLVWTFADSSVAAHIGSANYINMHFRLYTQFSTRLSTENEFSLYENKLPSIP